MTDVLYVAWNRLEYTRESFTALLANTDWSRVDTLYVHDDGSTDGTTDWLVGAVGGCPARHVLHRRRLGGPVAAMNWYLDQEGADRFAKVDNDFVVCPGWLPALEQVLDEHPELDVLGTEPWFGDPRPSSDPRGYEAARHIGGKGLIRRSAFEYGRPTPGGWNGYQGFTQWQERTPAVLKGWVKPDLFCFGLDQVPGPLHELALEYRQRDWQRLWEPYETDAHYAWWRPAFP